jgi:hypothetical protein
MRNAVEMALTGNCYEGVGIWGVQGGWTFRDGRPACRPQTRDLGNLGDSVGVCQN